jgi:hypothetical protein
MRTPFVLPSILLAFLLIAKSPPVLSQIIADHIVVDKYDNIPQVWIDEVKKMWVIVAGESHSKGFRIGCQLLENLDPRFQVNIRESGTPEGYTDQYMRLSRATWGDYNSASGWIYSYGEEDWFTNATAIARTKAHLTYCNTNNLQIAAMGFGWCWDMTADNWPGGTPDPVHQVRWAGRSYNGPEGSLRWGLNAEDQALTNNSVCMDTYLNATQEYMNYCQQNAYPTKMFFTTGPVDGNSNRSENGYQRSIKHQYIKDFVLASSDRILFDYSDILCHSDAGDEQTLTWTDFGGTLRSFPYIHDDNMLDLDGSYSEDGDHIGQRGALRLAKAMWWMLARMAGWDGQTVGVSQIPAQPRMAYPNPAGDYIRIPLSANAPILRVTISDITGKQFLEFFSPENELIVDLSGFNPGVYLIGCHNGNGSEYQRFMKR